MEPLPFNLSLRSSHLVQGRYARSSASVSRAASSARPSWPATVRLYDTGERFSKIWWKWHGMTRKDENREFLNFAVQARCKKRVWNCFRKLSPLNHTKSLKHIKIRATHSIINVKQWLIELNQQNNNNTSYKWINTRGFCKNPRKNLKGRPTRRSFHRIFRYVEIYQTWGPVLVQSSSIRAKCTSAPVGHVGCSTKRRTDEGVVGKSFSKRPVIY